MDLSTKYLGLDLPHPFMPGASPMVEDMDTVRRLEDGGAAAIVMNSLFEEQIVHEQVATAASLDGPADSFAEALSYFPEPDTLALGPDEYLEQVQRIREAVSVPVIGSLNGTTTGRWLDYAEQIEQAGAHALELNVYQLATDPEESGAELEKRTIEVVAEVRKRIGIPIAVKLSPFYSALANFAKQLVAAGADGLVIFNRFYQADIDVDELEVERTLHLSDSSELLLRLRWLAVLSASVDTSLAVTGGVHSGLDAIKSVMTGAHAVQLVSALFRRGPEYLTGIRRRVEEWLVEHEYESLDQMRGSMNLARSPDPAAYERANYMHILQGWTAEL
ncbi:MAG: dihydroorotate dehydrogenase-like protein [Acidobacteria bacterium]|nr:MAG: dihydroorotate dehydrogenase-like protein [Acidobacteriota bacterium]